MMRMLALMGCVLTLALAGCGQREVKGEDKFTGKVVTSYDEALASAKSENRPILVVAYQDSLDMIERNLLGDPSVKERSSKFITAKLDAASQAQAISQLGITQYPAMLILRPDGTPVWRSRGMPLPGEVATALDQASGSGSSAKQ